MLIYNMKKNFMKYLIFIVSLFSINLKAQDYSLKALYSDFYFYNGLQKNQEIYFGTDKGIVTLDNDFQLLLVNNSLKGPIKIDSNDVIIKRRINNYNNTFNHLLPERFLKSFGFTFEDFLYVISSGKLFIFELNQFNFTPYESVRSISDRFVGTYAGVFYDNIKLSEPTFTDSYIREFPEASFICWNGLTMISSEGIQTWNKHEKNGFEFGGSYLGSAHDIIEIKHPNYIISTSEGLFKINVKTEENSLLVPATYKPFNFNYYDYVEDELKLLYYSNENALFQYVLDTEENITIYSEIGITDVLRVNTDEVLVLEKNGLKKINLLTKENLLIASDIIEPHNVGVYYNYIFVSSNFGLSLYNTNEKKFIKNCIVDEFNNKAYYVSNNSLFLGSVTGLYEFSPENLDDLYYKKLQEQYLLENKEVEYKIDYQAIYLALFILLIAIISFLGHNINKKLYKPDSVFNLEKEIKAYIEQNISNVTVDEICSEFNVSTNRLYKIMNNKKPGKYISEQRINLVNKLKNQKINMSEISKKTGFSVSYLKQIRKK